MGMDTVIANLAFGPSSPIPIEAHSDRSLFGDHLWGSRLWGLTAIGSIQALEIPTSEGRALDHLPGRGFCCHQAARHVDLLSSDPMLVFRHVSWLSADVILSTHSKNEFDSDEQTQKHVVRNVAPCALRLAPCALRLR